MIARIWHGWTTEDDAETYEKYIREDVFPGIEARGIEGYRGYQLFKLSTGDEVEYMTVLRFESMANVKEFAGEHYEEAHLPDRAKELLVRYDICPQHYTVLEGPDGDQPA
jgi:heme-degrading monooxygenase HmoA